MYRRTLLVGCLLPVAVAGCLGARVASDEGAGVPENALQEAYILDLEPPENSIDEDEPVCEFNELPDAAQHEFEQTIEDGEHRVEETPVIRQRGCHNGYIEYEGSYYWLRISVDSG